MVTFTLRFYGRFVLAREQREGRETGNVKFLMPRMEYGGEFETHVPLMSALRSAVALDRGTTLQPSFRTVGVEAPGMSELFHWDLREQVVAIASSGGVGMNYVAPIIDLQELERLRNVPNASLDLTHLQPSARVAAVVELQGGELTALVTRRNLLAMIVESDGRAGSNVPQEQARTFANFVTVVLRVPGQAEEGPEGLPVEVGRLTVQVGGKLVTFTASGAGTVISFSDLCPCLPTAQPCDFEFGQYHNLLTATHPDRLIPYVSHGGIQDCDDFCTISYDGVA